MAVRLDIALVHSGTNDELPLVDFDQLAANGTTPHRRDRRQSPRSPQAVCVRLQRESSRNHCVGMTGPAVETVGTAGG